MIIHCVLISALYIGFSDGQFGGGMMGMMGMGMGGACPNSPCFEKCDDKTLANAFPFARQTPCTCEQCMQLCNDLAFGPPPYTCASAVYDCNDKTCDLFAVRDTSMGGFGGRKKRGGHRGRNGGGCKKCPVTKSYKGRTYFTPTGMCPPMPAGGDAGGASTAAPGGASTSGGSYSGAPGGETTTSASTSTTSSSVAKKKMIKDTPMRRKDAVAPCAVLWKNGSPTCQGITFVGTKRRKCTPARSECTRH